MLEPCQKHPNALVKAWKLSGINYWTAGCVLYAECWTHGGTRAAVESDWNFKQERQKTKTKKGK